MVIIFQSRGLDGRNWRSVRVFIIMISFIHQIDIFSTSTKRRKRLQIMIAASFGSLLVDDETLSDFRAN